MIGFKQINFKFKKLYQGPENTGFSVVPSEMSKMWRVRWPDGVLSEDHYNLARAKNHCASSYLKTQNLAVAEPVDAFSEVES